MTPGRVTSSREWRSGSTTPVSTGDSHWAATFVRNTAEEQLVFLFILQPNRHSVEKAVKANCTCDCTGSFPHRGQCWKQEFAVCWEAEGVHPAASGSTTIWQLTVDIWSLFHYSLQCRNWSTVVTFKSRHFNKQSAPTSLTSCDCFAIKSAPFCWIPFIRSGLILLEQH